MVAYFAANRLRLHRAKELDHYSLINEKMC